MNSKPRPDGLHIDLAEFNRRVQILIEKSEKGQLSIDDLLRLKLDLNRMARGLRARPSLTTRNPSMASPSLTSRRSARFSGPST